jgi:hypothetical protein
MCKVPGTGDEYPSFAETGDEIESVDAKSYLQKKKLGKLVIMHILVPAFLIPFTESNHM